MRSKQLPVHPDRRLVIDGAEVQHDARTVRRGLDRDRAAVPAGSKEGRVSDPACRRFRSERYADRRRPGHIARAAPAARAIERKLPVAVQRDSRIANELRPRIAAAKLINFQEGVARRHSFQYTSDALRGPRRRIRDAERDRNARGDVTSPGSGWLDWIRVIRGLGAQEP